MNIFKLAVQFEGDQIRLGYDILRGVQSILFVEGSFSLKPGDEFPVIVRGDIPAAAIATTGKITLVPMTANEAKHILAITPPQEHNGNGGIEVKVFTEIHIAEIEILPMCTREATNKRYAEGTLRHE